MEARAAELCVRGCACTRLKCVPLPLPHSPWYCRYRAKKRKEEQRRQKEEAEAAAKESAAEAAAAKKGEKGEEKRKRWVAGGRQGERAGMGAFCPGTGRAMELDGCQGC